jgi:hypothetical protein
MSDMGFLLSARKKARGASLFRSRWSGENYLSPYYQDTKSNDKACQSFEHVSAWKSRGIKEHYLGLEVGGLTVFGQGEAGREMVTVQVLRKETATSKLPGNAPLTSSSTIYTP